jgi:hypothetical protein
MKYNVIVCKCKYRLLNLIDKADATRKSINALRSYAKDVKCHFSIGVKKCPRCGADLSQTPPEQSLKVGSLEDADATGTAVGEFLRAK